MRIRRSLAIWLACVLTAFDLPLVRAQSTAPYGPSPVIRGVEWDFKDLIRVATTTGKGGSDLWPTTWAADGNIYTGWGDGGGFSGESDNTGRVSLGFARIIGLPPQMQGVDVWGYYPKYAEHPATFCGKPVSMLAVDGLLYAWVSSWFNESRANFVHCAPNPDPVAHWLAWSDDLGATWSLSPWKLERLGGRLAWCSFLNFGENYRDARDKYVYLYWRVEKDYGSTYLARVPQSDLKKNPAAAFEYFGGLSSVGQGGVQVPLWLRDVSEARPVFVDPAGRAITHVAYNSGLRRYIAGVQGRTVAETGLFDAPEPWGPWTTVAYYENWGGFGGRESLGVDFPVKWISKDGKTMWAVFSGGRLGPPDDMLDSFNLVKLSLALVK